jgi:superfamily II DNA or RNA helicase
VALPKLRAWQDDAIKAWNASSQRGCMEVATGGGKTTLALAIFQRLRDKDINFRILVVVPTTALLDQWFLALQDDLGLDPEDIKILSSKDLDPDRVANLVIINTARNINRVTPARPLFFVVDECHRAGSPENSKALNVQADAYLGLSATPHRDYDDGFEQYVEPALGKILISYSIADALRDGVLAPLSLTYLRVPLLPEEQEEYNRLSRAIGQAFAQDHQDRAERLLRARARLYNSARYRLPVTVRLMNTRRGTRTLIFLESIELAKRMTTALDDEGHSVVLYHSEQSPHLRRSNLRGFRRGTYDVLVACRALDEGFNVPEAQLAIIAAGTSSRRQRVQRFGRVLRTVAGKDLAEVITLYATDVEEKRYMSESTQLENSAAIIWQAVSLGE